MTKAQKIAASFDRARRYCPKPAQPDAWMALVLSTMGAEELRREIAAGDKSADELRWLKAELSKRSSV